MTKPWSIWIGFDPREAAAYAVARASVLKHLTQPIPTHGLVLDDLRSAGLFWRPQERRDAVLWDLISDAPCATEFSISRFLVPHLAGSGLALFMDCDMLARANLVDLFRLVESDPGKAIYCVKHDHRPESSVKMDGQVQTRYPRKNWSSLVIFDVDHPANAALTVDAVNSATGRDLHRFCWLDDDDIGEIPIEWNWLAGHSPDVVYPRIVHHTDGSPCMAGYENAPFADEWRAALTRWAA